jgi:hypothetical protein
MWKSSLLVAAMLSCLSARPRIAEAVEPETADEGPGYWSDWRNVAGWSLMGAGTAMFGLWIGSWVRFDEVEEQWEADPEVMSYRRLVGTNGDVCDYAATDPEAWRVLDLCDEAYTWSTIWNVALPLWIVFWGTGTGFLIWYAVEPSTEEGDDAAAGGWQVAWSPYLTRTGGGVGLSGRF